MTGNRQVSGGVVVDVAPHQSKRSIVTVYRQARRQAQFTSTLRLRWCARRAHRTTNWDDHRDLARLAALRDELRARGVEVGPL